MSALQAKKEQDQKNYDDYVERKLQQLNSRQKGKQRKERRLAGDDMTMEEFRGGPLKVGEKVRVKENRMVGEVIRVSNKAVTIAVGSITSMMPLDKVERISSNEYKAATKAPEARIIQRVNEDLNARRLKFSPEVDVRGARLQEAMDIVVHYIDDAIVLNVGSIRIIHGKGTGVLRDELQKYLRTVPGISSVRDEHVQFGGAGVTVVNFE